MSPIASGGGSSGGATPTLSQVLTTGNSAGASTVNMNSNKITSVATGTATGDAANWGQCWNPFALAYMVTGSSYYPTFLAGQVGTASLTQNQLVYSPLWVPNNCTTTTLSISVTTGGGSGSVIRFGIYSSGSNSRPNALVVDGGTAASTAIATTSVSVSQALTGGNLYWLAIAAQVGTPPTVRAMTANDSFTPWIPGGGAWLDSQTVSGALPAPGTLTATLNTVPWTNVTV